MSLSLSSSLYSSRSLTLNFEHLEQPSSPLPEKLPYFLSKNKEEETRDYQKYVCVYRLCTCNSLLAIWYKIVKVILACNLNSCCVCKNFLRMGMTNMLPAQFSEVNLIQLFMLTIIIIIMSFSDYYYVTTISELFLHLIVGCVIIVRWWLGDGPTDGF